VDLGQQIAVYLGIFLLIWYIAASAYNRRLGIGTYRWLQAGVKTLGKITQAKWIGSSGSGARIGVDQATKPFRRVEVSYLLETRELLPLWLINRARGQRDRMFVRAQLRAVPYGEVEILPAGSRMFGGLLSAETKNPWAMSDRQMPHGLRAAWRGRDTDRLLDMVSPVLERVGGSIRRLSLARTQPHLIMEVNIDVLSKSDSAEFFSLLTTTIERGQKRKA
jgi:hypothetical protein